MVENAEVTDALGFFEKYLTIWVLICIAIGTLIGWFFPGVPFILSKLEYAHISIPIAVLLWLMIYPMMIQIDFREVHGIVKHPKPVIMTSFLNWGIKPWSMFFFSWIFFMVIFRSFIPPDVGRGYLAGAVILGSVPCTAMVFVWSYLARGDPNFTLLQVAVDDLLMLVFYTPIVVFLLGLSEIPIPYKTMVLSVTLFVGIPLLLAHFSRGYLLARKSVEWFERVLLARFRIITIVALLLTLIIIFCYQGNTIISEPGHILLIIVPLTIQTLFIFGFGYSLAKILGINYEIAAPAAMIAASNFFEFAVAVTVTLFGVTSPAALVPVVGVMEEVPIMLLLVAIARRTRHIFS